MKAVVFDVDGTLYSQAPLRRAMVGRLLAMLITHPVRGWRTLRILSAYRKAQESLRSAPSGSGIAAAQIRLAAERTRTAPERVVQDVTRWMEVEPLPFLARCAQPGMLDLVQTCRTRGIRLGALSDYPAAAKLDALGLAGMFDVVLCAQQPEIDVLKPDPRGLLLAMQRLGAAAAETLYVGDRLDVDLPTARAAGVRCAILDHRHTAPSSADYVAVGSLAELRATLWP